MDKDQKTAGPMPPITRQYWHMIRTSWEYAGHRKKQMILIYVLFMLANIAFMFQPWLIGQLINTLQSGGDDILSQTVFWLGLYVGSMFAFWMFHGPARVIERKLSFFIKRNFNLRFYEMLTRLPFNWHHKNHSGNTINRINKSADALYRFSGTQFLYIEVIVRLGAVFFALALIDWRVSIALFLFTTGLFFIVNRFDRVIMRKIHAVNEGEHIFSSYKFDFISNIYNVITFNAINQTRRQLKDRFDDFYTPYKQQIILNEYKWFIMMILIVISHFGVLLFYIWYHIQPSQVLMLGTLVTIFQYMQRLDGVIFNVGGLYLQLVQAYTDQRSTAPLAEDYKLQGIEDDDQPNLKVAGGAIEFNNLSFSYDGQNRVFNGLSLKIPAGQKVGIIGPSGAGKSSLVNILQRFNPDRSLDVKIDGQDISDVNNASLRDAIAIIPQDTSLFQDTLLENIRYGAPGSTDEQVIEAAKKAYVDDFVRLLPDGYNTHVGERGVKLSGGQRQRVAIARAILKDSPILILDEATSALDSKSEILIQKSFETLMQDKTVIAIAHRLSTISHLDRLIVLEDGQIVEDGPHEELLVKGGLYAKLWSLQSGGFLKEKKPEDLK